MTDWAEPLMALAVICYFGGILTIVAGPRKWAMTGLRIVVGSLLAMFVAVLGYA